MKDNKKTKQQLLEELENLRIRSDSLSEVSSRMAHAQNADEVLNLIVNESTRLLGANAAYIRLMEGDGLVASAATDSATEFLAELAAVRPTNSVQVGSSVTGHVMATKEPLIMEDAADQDVVSQDTSNIREKYEMHGTAAVPLLADGKSIGVLVVVDKRISREQREMTQEIERNNEAAKQEQERIVRAQSLDSYFDGISTLLLRDEDGVLNEMARNLIKGRTDAILKILKPDEKRNLVAFLYGSGLISRNSADVPSVVALSGSDLSQAELSGIDLRKAGFGGANLKGAQIVGADLDHSDLRGADLSQANLDGTDLSNSDMHGVIAAAANFSSVDLCDSDLSGADLHGVDFTGADLESANLSGSNLRGAIFTGTNLSSANLSSANLSGANLREASLVGANLLDTRLSNLIGIEDADFSDAQNFSEDNREYLRSIATGAHPETGKDTAESLESS